MGMAGGTVDEGLLHLFPPSTESHSFQKTGLGKRNALRIHFLPFWRTTPCFLSLYCSKLRTTGPISKNPRGLGLKGSTQQELGRAWACELVSVNLPGHLFPTDHGIARSEKGSLSWRLSQRAPRCQVTRMPLLEMTSLTTPISDVTTLFSTTSKVRKAWKKWRKGPPLILPSQRERI